uniref:PGG domain-containing protein n=1 Tax=Oryza glumipatula TaxID=40148 RepID=A0A0E0BK55_9ORYZ
MSTWPSEDGDHASVVLAVAPKPQNLTSNVVVPPATGASGGGTGSRRGGSGLFALRQDDSGVLLVVATLITTLSYQVGTNVPGGYWQDDGPGHLAGEPIMRTQRRWLYRLFMWGSWIGFASSMGLSLALLTGMPPRSRFVRCLFVLSYSTLIFTFTTQQWPTYAWASVLVWAAVAVLIAAAITYRTHHHLRRFINWLFAEPDDQQS